MNLARLLPNRTVSIRLRLAALTTLVFVLMYVTLVVTDMKAQRDRLLGRERVHAEALLDHLVQMPEFRSDLGAASERLAALSTIHAHGGAQISIAMAGKRASTPAEVVGETLAELWIGTDRRVGAAQRLRRFHDPFRAGLGRIRALVSSMERAPTSIRNSIPDLSTELEALELLARREEQVLQASIGIVDQAVPPIVRKEPNRAQRSRHAAIALRSRVLVNSPG